MSRCKAMAYTNDPNELVIRCELEEHETGSHASKKDLAAIGAPASDLAAALNHAAGVINDFAVGLKDTLETFTPPKNLPHDPSLRRDRRKWGGK